MVPQSTFLAGVACLYSLSEFVIGRWVQGWVEGERAALLVRNGVTLLVLCMGTLGCTSWALAGGFAVALALRFLLETAMLGRTGFQTLSQFVLVQVVTLLLLGAAGLLASPVVSHRWYVLTEETILGWLGGPMAPNAARLLLTIAAYAFMFEGGSRIVRGVLDQFPALMERIASTRPASSENRGEWIGVLERVITLTFVLTGNYSAVAFALTAKSIARFKELDDRNFAEYYLLGTSTSVAVALITGTLVRSLS